MKLEAILVKSFMSRYSSVLSRACANLLMDINRKMNSFTTLFIYSKYRHSMLHSFFPPKSTYLIFTLSDHITFSFSTFVGKLFIFQSLKFFHRTNIT